MSTSEPISVDELVAAAGFENSKRGHGLNMFKHRSQYSNKYTCGRARCETVELQEPKRVGYILWLFIKQELTGHPTEPQMDKDTSFTITPYKRIKNPLGQWDQQLAEATEGLKLCEVHKPEDKVEHWHDVALGIVKFDFDGKDPRYVNLGKALIAPDSEKIPFSFTVHRTGSSS